MGYNINNDIYARVSINHLMIVAISGALSNVTYTTSISSWTKKHIDVFVNIDPYINLSIFQN